MALERQCLSQNGYGGNTDFGPPRTNDQWPCGVRTNDQLAKQDTQCTPLSGRVGGFSKVMALERQCFGGVKCSRAYRLKTLMSATMLETTRTSLRP